MSVDIRQARIDDLDAIQSFIRDAYGPFAPYKGPDRWCWQFQNNPANAKADGTAPVWLAWSDGRIVGQIAVQMGRGWFAEELRDFGWILDVMVLDGFRGQRIGHRLYDAIAESVPTTITLTMAPATRRIADKQHALTLPLVRSMFKPLRCSGEFVRRFLSTRAEESPRWQRPHALLRSGLASSGVAVSINTLSAIARALPGQRAPSTTTLIEEVGSFDAEVDALTSANAHAYDLVCARDHQYLNWRFVDVPHLRYRRFLMRDQGQLIGLLITREAEAVELPLGILTELFVLPGRESEAELLMTHAMQCFGPHMRGIMTGASAPWMVRMLRRRGFGTVRKHYPTVVTRDDHVRAVCGREGLSCLFTKSDHDWDQVHPA